MESWNGSNRDYSIIPFVKNHPGSDLLLFHSSYEINSSEGSFINASLEWKTSTWVKESLITRVEWVSLEWQFILTCSVLLCFFCSVWHIFSILAISPKLQIELRWNLFHMKLDSQHGSWTYKSRLNSLKWRRYDFRKLVLGINVLYLTVSHVLDYNFQTTTNFGVVLFSLKTRFKELYVDI